MFALFFAKKVRESKAITLPDLVKKQFGVKSSYLSALLNFFNILPITYVISVGLFIQFFTNGTLTQSMLIGTCLVVAYSLYGGFRAVVFSDLVQFFLMCSSVFFVFILSIQKFGGLDFLQANLPSNHLSLTGGESLATIFVWGFIALSTLVDPNFYHRCFAAKSTKTAQKGIFISTIIWICFDICTTFGALYAKATLPDADSNLAYLQHGMTILPHGLRGLFAAGILATIFSTLDSYLFLAGTTISVDLLPPRHQFKKIFHHLAVVFSACLAFSLALIFDGNIKSVWKSLGSLSAGSLLLPLALAQLKAIKLSDHQFFMTCLLSCVAMFLWKTRISASTNLNIDTLYIGILVSGICIFISQLTPSHNLTTKNKTK